MVEIGSRVDQVTAAQYSPEYYWCKAYMFDFSTWPFCRLATCAKAPAGNLFRFCDARRGSRVIFPNGEIDPWHALGVLETPMPDLPAIYVQGEMIMNASMYCG